VFALAVELEEVVEVQLLRQFQVDRVELDRTYDEFGVVLDEVDCGGSNVYIHYCV